MKLKAENKVGAHQGEHCSIRITHFSGIQVRQFDARLDIIFLLVPRPLSPSAFSANTPPRTLLGGVPSFGGEGVFNRST